METLNLLKRSLSDNSRKDMDKEIEFIKADLESYRQLHMYTFLADARRRITDLMDGHMANPAPSDDAA